MTRFRGEKGAAMKVISTEAVVEQLIDLGDVARAIYDANRSSVAPTWENTVENVRAFVMRQAKAATEEVIRQIVTEGDDRVGAL